MRDLEGQALRSARRWRVVFGSVSVLCGAFFTRLACITAMSDGTNLDRVWSQPVHLELYVRFHDPPVTLFHVFWLDATTAVALLLAGASMCVSCVSTLAEAPAGDRILWRGRFANICGVAGIGAGAASAAGWVAALREVARGESSDTGFVSPQKLWIACLALLLPIVCYLCDKALSRTIQEMRSLRNSMYSHKRA